MTLYDDFNAAGKAVLDSADALLADKDHTITTLTDSLIAANARIVELDAHNVALQAELANLTGDPKPTPLPDVEV